MPLWKVSKDFSKLITNQCRILSLILIFAQPPSAAWVHNLIFFQSLHSPDSRILESPLEATLPWQALTEQRHDHHPSAIMLCCKVSIWWCFRGPSLPHKAGVASQGQGQHAKAQKPERQLLKQHPLRMLQFSLERFIAHPSVLLLWVLPEYNSPLYNFCHHFV